MWWTIVNANMGRVKRSTDAWKHDLSLDMQCEVRGATVRLLAFFYSRVRSS